MIKSNQARFLLLLLCVIAGSCALSSCDSSTSVVWAKEVKSPDGTMIAQAHTISTGGFGTAALPYTSVYLKFARTRWPPTQILSFVNPTDQPVGVTAVEMKWLTNSHLDVTYGKQATLAFQAVKADRVQITVHQVGQ